MDRIKEIAKRIDHTILKADASSEQVRKVCDECRKYGFGMIAINGAQVELCRRELEGTDTHVGAAIGFPLGQMDL